MKNDRVGFQAMARRPDLVAEAVNALAASIRGGSFAPGARLPSEGEIARGLGVSRPVVREAIASLKADGLVDSRRGLGLFVSSGDTLKLRLADIATSNRTLLDFLEFRLGLETEAARLAALRRTDDDIAAMRDSLAALEAAHARGWDSAPPDLAFHLAIARAAHSSLYEQVLTSLSGRLLKTMRVMRDGERHTPRHAEMRQANHDRILASIEESDPQRAGAAMQDHIGESYRRYAGMSADTGPRSPAHPTL